MSTPREVRNVLRYVLCNRRRHAAERGHRLARGWLDPYSSGAWFDGWRQAFVPREPWERELVAEPPPTAPARVWLLTTGWKRRGLLGIDETPGAAAES